MTAQDSDDDLIERVGRFAPEFDGLANHEPMVVAALELLGADRRERIAFSDAYHRANPLVLSPAPTTPVADWESCLGLREREPDLRVFFAAEVERLGSSATVGRYLPRLALGVSASAFHPLMRLAYAVLRDDPGETARALAYWAATYLPMPDGAGVDPITSSPARVLELVAAEVSLRALPVQYLLWHNIRQMGAAPAFAPVVGWLDMDEGTLERMARDSLALFAATGDFCALHAVTGTHWIRVVTADHPAVRPTLLRYFWQGVAGLMGEMGFPALPDETRLEEWRRRSDLPGWEEIRAIACGSSDEHDVSLTYSAWQEDQRYGDDLYRFAAAGRLGLIDAGWPPGPDETA